MRSESIWKAEEMGKEMDNEVKMACKRVDWRKERCVSTMEESDWSGFESLQKKVGRLARRAEEPESERKTGRGGRQMMESSSESEEGGGKWRWDQSKPPRTNQLEIEAEDFSDD